MRTMKKLFILLFLNCLAVWVYGETIHLQTANLDECLEISSFVSNTKGELFLFSPRTFKIFKFDKGGKFVKSFCRNGIGPGEIMRVSYMFHNPANDYLYLPEVYSGVGRISMFDSDGYFKNYMKIEVSPQQKDKVVNLKFLADGSFYAIIDERIDWEPSGNFFITKDRLTVLYFSAEGKLKQKIYETIKNGEFADKRRWGGPGIFFNPDILLRTTLEGDICIGKTDENEFHFYNKKGIQIKNLKIDIKKQLLEDAQFEKTKAEFVEALKKDDRMQMLAKHMIKLEYKPIYFNYFILPKHIAITDVIKADSALGRTKETKVSLYDRSTGRLISSQFVKDHVMGISNHLLFIMAMDEEENESFRVETLKY
jgi:hypothetical protein